MTKNKWDKVLTYTQEQKNTIKELANLLLYELKTHRYLHEQGTEEEVEAISVSDIEMELRELINFVNK